MNTPQTTHCSKCGTELEVNVKVCPFCGEIIEPPAPQPDKNRISALTSAFAGNLFLAICVLITVAAVISFSFVNILFAVFCWIIYFNAKNSNLNVPMMRSVSGTVFVCRVFYFIGAVSLLLAAALVFVLAIVVPPEVAGEVPEIYDKIMAGVNQDKVPSFVIDIIEMLLAYGIKEFICFIASAIAALGAYLLALGIIWGGIHKFAKELYTKIEMGTKSLEHAEKGAFCLMISGVVMAAFAIFEASISFVSTVPALLTAAAMIVGSVFVKNNFKK